MDISTLNLQTIMNNNIGKADALFRQQKNKEQVLLTLGGKTLNTIQDAVQEAWKYKPCKIWQSWIGENILQLDFTADSCSCRDGGSWSNTHLHGTVTINGNNNQISGDVLWSWTVEYDRHIWDGHFAEAEDEYFESKEQVTTLTHLLDVIESCPR